jgi:hypothetical protein
MLRNLFISDLHLCVRVHEYGIAIYCLSHKTKKSLFTVYGIYFRIAIVR